MKRFFLFTVLLLGLLGGVARAATVTLTMIDLTGAPDDDTVVFTPDDPPRNTAQGLVKHKSLAVPSVGGVVTLSLVQGPYRVSIRGEVLKHICVPAGSGTYSLHLGQLDCGNVGLYLGSNAQKVLVSTNDATPGVLGEKVTAGTNVVLTTQTDGSGVQSLQINSIALSGATFDTNTLTLTFTGSGGIGGGGGGSSIAWGQITGTPSNQADLQAALNGKQDASSSLTAWSLILPAAKQDASGNLAAWSAITTSSKQPASGNLTNWSGLATASKQDASANLSSWSALAPSSKQDASSNLAAWSAVNPSAKQDADSDLTSLASGVTGLVKGAGNGSGYSAAVSGTDYAPATSGSAILAGSGSGGFSPVTIGTGLNYSGGTLTATSTGTGNGNAILTNALASKAVVTDSATNLTTSATTAAELGYVSGVTSAIQTQLNAKQAADTDLNSLSSGITGLVKGGGNGGGYSAAVAGTDYAAAGSVSASGLTVATNIVLLGRTSGANGAIELIVVGNGLSLSGNTLSMITNLVQVNVGTLVISNAISSGSLVVTNGLTNLSLTASAIVKAGADKSLQTAVAGTDYQVPITTNLYVQAYGFIAGWDGYFNKNAAGTKSTVDGVLNFLNWSENGFTRAVWGPSDSSHPAIKANGTTLQARTGDDTADVPVTAFNFQASDGFFGVSKGGFRSWQDGYVTFYNFSENGFTEAQYGGTNSAPAFRPNSTGFSDVVAGTSGATPTFRLGSSLVTAKTANYSVLASDSRTHFTNAGATNSVNFTLPTWASGLTYTFTVTDAQTLTVTAPASNTIRIGGSVTTTAGNVTTNTVGNSVTITATKNNQWHATSHEGTWTLN